MNSLLFRPFLEVKGYITNGETRAMLNTLRGPDSDQEAAISVVTGLISMVSEKIPLPQLGMLLELSMDVLCQSRPTVSTLNRLKDSLESDNRLALSRFRRDFVISRVRTQLEIHSNDLC